MRLFKSHLFKSSIFAGILAVAFASCGNRPQSNYFSLEASPNVLELEPGAPDSTVKVTLIADQDFSGGVRLTISAGMATVPYLIIQNQPIYFYSQDVSLSFGQKLEVPISVRLPANLDKIPADFLMSVEAKALNRDIDYDQKRNVAINIKGLNASGFNIELPGKIVVEQGKLENLPITVHRFGNFTDKLQISLFNVINGKSGQGNEGTSVINQFKSNPIDTTNGDSLNLGIQTDSAPVQTYGAVLLVKNLANLSTREYAFDLQVIAKQQPAQDFNISANPASKNANPGSQVQFDFTVNKLNGFNSTVNLVAKNLPAGITVANQTENSMTFNVSSNVAQGAYPITIEASGGGLTKSTNITINVNQQPSFTLSANPNNVMATTSSTTPVNIQAARTNYSDVINLTIQSPVAGISLNSQNGVNQIQANSNSTMFNLVTSDSAPAGNYKIMIQGASLDGKLIASTELMVSVTAKPDFSISTTNRSVDSGDNGQVISLPIQVTRTNFDKPITVFLSNVSFGGATSTAITSNSATINANTGMLDLQIKPKIATGDYVITIKGTGQGVDDRLATAMISVRDFNLKLNNKNPDTIINATVFYGKSLTLPMVATRIFGHTTPITAICNVTGLPSGVTVSANPQSIMATNSSNITFSVDPESEIPEGTYPIILRACTNVKAIEFKVNLTITYPDDF